MKTADLPAALASLAESAVDLQRMFDDDHAAILSSFLRAGLVPDQGGLAGSLWRTVLPNRIHVRDWQVTLNCGVQTFRQAGARIVVWPINAGYEVMFSAQSDSSSGLTLSVAQNPTPTPTSPQPPTVQSEKS